MFSGRKNPKKPAVSWHGIPKGTAFLLAHDFHGKSSVLYLYSDDGCRERSGTSVHFAPGFPAVRIIIGKAIPIMKISTLPGRQHFQHTMDFFINLFFYKDLFRCFGVWRSYPVIETVITVGIVILKTCVKAQYWTRRRN